jgi:hypothetical protein
MSYVQYRSLGVELPTAADVPFSDAWVAQKSAVALKTIEDSVLGVPTPGLPGGRAPGRLDTEYIPALNKRLFTPDTGLVDASLIPQLKQRLFTKDTGLVDAYAIPQLEERLLTPETGLIDKKLMPAIQERLPLVVANAVAEAEAHIPAMVDRLKPQIDDLTTKVWTAAFLLAAVSIGSAWYVVKHGKKG